DTLPSPASRSDSLIPACDRPPVAGSTQRTFALGSNRRRAIARQRARGIMPARNRAQPSVRLRVGAQGREGVPPMRIVLRWLLAAAALLAATAAHAQMVYKSVAPDGTVVYSDKPPENGKADSVTDLPKPAVGSAGQSPNGVPLQAVRVPSVVPYTAVTH